MSRKNSRDLELFIVDIFVAIQKIKSYVQSFANLEDFRHSSLHWDAVIRQLEIIGEALNKLLDDEQLNAASPAYFRKIVNFRNVITHGYFGIDPDEVWNVIEEKLDLLNDDLKTVTHTINLAYAIETEIDEYTRLKDTATVAFLRALKNGMQ